MPVTIVFAAILGAALNGAQAVPADMLDAAAPAVDPAMEESAAPADDAAAREARLDTLFGRLADPSNPEWQRAQSEIVAIWNESGSPSMDLLARRADKAVEAQDLDTALTFLNDLVRLAPDYAAGWNRRATIYFLRDEYGRALQDIAHTLALAPRHYGAWAGLGIILDRLGDEKGALHAYRRAIEIHPHLPGAAEGIRKLTLEVEGVPL